MFVLTIALVCAVWWSARRFRSADDRLRTLEHRFHELEPVQHVIDLLTARVNLLERQIAVLDRGAVPPVTVVTPQRGVVPPVDPTAAPVAAAPAAPPAPAVAVRPVVKRSGFSPVAPTSKPKAPPPSVPPHQSEPTDDALLAPPAPAAASRAMPVVQALGRTTAQDEQVRAERRLEWEAVIGGNWLNKLGVFVLVVGIALFLGYSFTQLGPAGRVGLGLAASATLLFTGVVFERRAGYAIFGRGLIGGGWAGVYFTTYAMHGLEAARVITSPVAATAALAAVAAGMIGHSLKYRSQVVTGLAYFVGFATLAITPATTFSLVATVPLAMSLLVVAQRFSWTPMAVVGLVSTYGAFVMTTARHSSVAPGQFLREQLVVALYWVVFEAFDLLSERRRSGGGPRRLLLPLNACGYVGASLLRWSASSPDTLSVLFWISTAAYATSAIARVVFLRDQDTHREALGPSLFDGPSYRLSVTLALALAVPAILLRFMGMQVNVALLLAAEFVFLAGLQFGDTYLRWLGSCALAVPVFKTVLLDLPIRESLAVGGLSMMRATPVALVIAGVLYLNRVLVSRRSHTDDAVRVITPETLFRAVGAALLAVVVGYETPHAYVGAAWVALALALFEVAARTRLGEIRMQAWAIGAVGLLAMVFVNVAEQRFGDWVPFAVNAALGYLCLARLELAGADTLPARERRWAWPILAWSAAVAASGFLWAATPSAYLAAAWMLLALALFELGLRPRLAGLRQQAYALTGLACVAALFGDVLVAPGAHRDTLALMTALVEVAVVRLFLPRAERLGEDEREWARQVSSWMGAFFLAALTWHLAPRPWLGVAWLVLAMALIETALRVQRTEWRQQAYAVAVLALVTLGVDAFPATVDRWELLSVVGTGSVLLWVGFLRSLWLPDRLPEGERALARDVAAGGGALLSGVLMWQLLPLPVVAVGWAVLALIMLDLGFSISVESLRLYGHLAMASTLVRIVMANLTTSGVAYGVSHRLLTVVPAIALLYFVRAWLSRVSGGEIRAWERSLPRLYHYAATSVAVLLVGFEFGRTVAAAGWAALAVGLVAIGRRSKGPDWRWQGDLVAVLAFARGWATDFYIPESLAGAPGRLVTAAIAIACFYAAQLLSDRSRHDGSEAVHSWLLIQIDRHARTTFSVMATVLLATLLFHELTWGLVTIGWAAQGMALLAAGFAASDRVLRRSGLLLLGICTVKAFAYDFRALDTLSRILSFIVLGVLMLATSWVYARYSERLRKYW